MKYRHTQGVGRGHTMSLSFS